MFEQRDYELIDFGDGRKLERFGAAVLDRPAPAVEGEAKADPRKWTSDRIAFRRISGRDGTWRGKPPANWKLRHGEITLELKLTPFGHVGVFAEQAENWDWITRQISRAGRSLRVLNLFAYTGGSTLTAAAAGAEVTHVDAAKNTVAWARRNAEASGLTDAPIRWITEDAVKFVERELRREARYDAVILDPPSYGHGTKSGVWKIERHLFELLKNVGQLIQPQPAFVLLTCHSPGFGPAELEAMLSDAIFGRCGVGATARPLSIRSGERNLPSGVVARWPK